MENQLCITEGCTKTVHVKKRGLCRSHYQAWARKNKPRVGHKPCTINGCEGFTYARNYCQSHYERWHKYGDAEYQRVYMYEQTCLYCDNQAHSRNMCHNHYTQWWMKNSTAPFNPEHWSAKEVPGYQAAHYRVWRIKGKASDHNCQDCGGSASDWSLKHNPTELYVLISDNPRTNGSMYSLNVDDYEPRCRDCHKAYDAKWDNRKGVGGRPKKVQS